MATKRIVSVRGRRFRMTRLDSCGAHVVGTCSKIISDGFVMVTLTGEYEEGEDVTQKNAWGDFCAAERDQPRLKWANVAMQFCDVDPDVADFVGGGAVNPVISGSDTVGITVGQAPNDAAFAIEVWGKLAGNACTAGVPEWAYFVVPFIKNGRLDGDLPFGRVQTFNARGDGVPAPSTWGTTPYTDNPLLRTGGFPTGDIFGVARTTVQPPAALASCGSLA